ncbi:MAG: S8 family serine peptidase [Bdellovibrionaceae bacterium]|nr:S8 family serine peptidase [Pseudobdellovibrionaceae bacterium]
MKRLIGLAAGLVLFTAASSQAAPAIDRELVAFARTQGMTAKTMRVLALVDGGRAEQSPRRYDHRQVMRFLKMRARKSQELITRHLQNAPAGEQVRILQYYWINNSLVAEVTPAGLKALAQAPGIERVYLNRKIDEIRPFARRAVTRRDVVMGLAGDNWPYSLKDIGIDALAEEMPNLDGSGVMLGTIDTGIDGKHPALAGKVAIFYDASTGKQTEPVDEASHGTHTAGTMVGGDRKNVKIGVAPGAKLIGSAALTGYDAMLKGMEFMLDPDGNPDTADFPRAINNSWNCNGAPDVELFYRAISAWEAAGILPIFSAGNSGPGDETITKPHEHPSVVAVAATDEAGKVTGFSSRGPARFRGELVQKPDISAPGKDVVSSIPGGRLEAMSGTSMAAPHVTGVTALLMQANPKITPAQMREILIKSSKFVDLEGSTIPEQKWNKAYGLGRMNAQAAVKMALKIGEGFRRVGRLMAAVVPSELMKVSFLVSAETVESDFLFEDVRIEVQGNDKWVSAWDVWADY